MFVGGLYCVALVGSGSFSVFPTLGTCAVFLQRVDCSLTGVLMRWASVGCTQLAKMVLSCRRALHVSAFIGGRRSVGF